MRTSVWGIRFNQGLAFEFVDTDHVTNLYPAGVEMNDNPAVDISAGADGVVWLVSSNGNTYRWIHD
jgi:hypothetical protein